MNFNVCFKENFKKYCKKNQWTTLQSLQSTCTNENV